VVALARVGIDWRAAIHQRVEESERAVETESLGTKLKNKEGRIACGFDVDGDELGLVQSCVGRQLGRIDGDFLPRYRLGGAARLEKDRLGNH
jgi:hypothetical protein